MSSIEDVQDYVNRLVSTIESHKNLVESNHDATDGAKSYARGVIDGLEEAVIEAGSLIEETNPHQISL